MIRLTSYLNLCVCLSSFKLLFLKSYVSTDFDVHRNWMAITFNLPIKDWYYDETSEWTLDYPPLFAYFEFFLSYIAHLFKLDDYLILTKESIRTEPILIYQKVTVILSDFFYYYAIYKLCRALKPIIQSQSNYRFNHQNLINKNKLKLDNNNELPSKEANKSKITEQQQRQPVLSSNKKNLLPVIQEQNLLDAIFRPDYGSSIALLLLLQPGLFLVDHIHFQYNGLLSGVFLLSVSNILSGFYVSGSFWFAILLNFKHIYLYSAPAFGMYLLTGYCMASVYFTNRIISFLRRIIGLGIVVVTVFAIIFGQFADLETLKQIASRLFPFKRGLTHAYWAPNIWSLYNSLDKVLSVAFRKKPVAKFDLESISGIKEVQASSTSGLVQEYEHQYLPSVKPSTTFILVAIFILPVILKFLLHINRPTRRLFLMSTALVTFTSFMFGWHVHEKAVILILLPLIPISLIDHQLRDLFLRLTLVGTYSLFPLLFKPGEYLTKLSLLLAYYCYSRSLINNYKNEEQRYNQVDEPSSAGFMSRFLRSIFRRLYHIFDTLLVLSIILVEIYITLVHGHINFIGLLTKLNKFDFLPLLLTSSISAIGITFSYLELYYYFIFCLDDEAAAAAC